jgi:hypothetical protein
MAACRKAGLKPGFIFVMDPEEEPLNTMIHNLCKINNVDLWIGNMREEPREDKREWNSIRYEKMVMLRNYLLQGVRRVAPPLFLSLDSDILLNADALVSMSANLAEKPEYAAVGGKAYMTHTGTQYPSFGQFRHANSMHRHESSGTFKVDVIMAIKLM